MSFENYNISNGQIKERIHKLLFKTQPAFCVIGKIYIPSTKENLFISFLIILLPYLIEKLKFFFSLTYTGIGKHTMKECNFGLSVYMEVSSGQSCLYSYILKD